MVLVLVTKADHGLDISLYGFGVLFSHKTDLELITDHHRHTFDIKLPTLDSLKEIPTPHCPSQGNETMIKVCRESLIYHQGLTRLQNLAVTQVKQNVRQIHSILRTKRSRETNQKIKRGLLDFIGKAAHFLFGVATQGDVVALEERITMIDQRTVRFIDEFQSQISRLSTGMSLVNERVNLIDDQLKLQVQWFNKLTQDFHNKWINAVQFSLFLAENLLNYTRILDNIQHFRLGAESLLAGKLHNEILNIKDIKTMLSHIETEIKRHQPSARVLVTDPSYFYKMSPFLAVKIQTLLFITLKIPITTLSTYFKLFEIKVYPKPVSDQIASSTIITGLHKYFAVSQDLNLYAVFDTLPQLEMGDHIHFLDKSEIQLLTDTNTCIFSLYRNDPLAVQTFCNFKLLSNKPSVLIPLPSNSFVVENIKNFSLSCPGSEDRSLDGCHSCIIKIPQTCGLSSDDEFVPPGIWPINNGSTKTHTQRTYSVNQIMLQSFFQRDQWLQIQAGETSEQSYLLQIPSFQIDPTISDHNSFLDETFNSTIQAIKRGEILLQNSFGTLVSESRVRSSVSDNGFVPVMFFINISLYMILIAIIIGIVYLYLKIRTAMILILALTAKLQIAEGSPRVIYPQTPLPPVKCECGVSMHLYLLSVILALIGLQILSYGIWRIFKNKSPSVDADERLYLRVSNLATQIDIYWFSLSHPFQQSNWIAKDNIRDLRLQRQWCSNILSFNWDLEITNENTNVRMRPPCTIFLSFWESQRLSNIIGLSRTFKVEMILVQKLTNQSVIIEPISPQNNDRQDRQDSLENT